MLGKLFNHRPVLIFMVCMVLVGCMTSCVNRSGDAFKTENLTKLDSLFASIEESGGWMGSISIFQDGEEVYNRAFGYANVQDRVKNNRDTKFRIGSLTDLYTATIVMKLVENGKLGLDTKLNEYFPEIMKSPRITVEDMLRHRSGIFNLMLDLDYWTYYYLPITEDELYRKIVDGGLVFEPGQKTQFSSSNYILLAMMAEKIEGKSYGRILDSMICNPLGLKNTYVGSSISIKDNEASSYYDKSPEWNLAKETDLTTAIGESSIVSTPYEVNLFVSSLFSGKLLSEGSVEKMKMVVDNTSLGLQRLDRNYPNLGVVGNIDGFASEMIYVTDADKNVVVSYFSNGSSASADIMAYALSVFFGEKSSLPIFKRQVVLSDDEMAGLVGVYANLQYSTSFEIVKDSAEHCLKLMSPDGVEAMYVECFENGEFSATFSDGDVPVDFSIVSDKGIMRLSNGMELKKLK
ncbi:MAG: serine hydrolase domain-containing protein [Paludibacteraceae bacterium]|nr:beta-lactamase family protein [Prevotellaceae bacterium]